MGVQSNKIPPHFLVIIPGWMGSNLQVGDRMIWGDFSHTFSNPVEWKSRLNSLFEAMSYPNRLLKPAGILNEVVFVTPMGKMQQYGRLLNHLRTMGYIIDPQDSATNTRAVYTFAYDWRQDNRISAQELARAIERWRNKHPGAQAWIIAHSNGGLVARWYIEKLGGKDYIGKLFLMGSPWDGTPIALQGLMDGLAILIRKVFTRYETHERSRDLIRTFPSLYQLLPHTHPFLYSTENDELDVFNGEGWLERKYHPLLEDGRRFNQELGTTLSVETHCFYGVQHSTLSTVHVSLIDDIHWGKFTWIPHDVGDGVVPRRSAIHPNAMQKLAYVTLHGDIYVAPDVLAQLKRELIDRFMEPERAIALTPRITVTSKLDKDVYYPGEEIALQITIVTNDDTPVPVSEAGIETRFLWLQVLPGATQTARPITSPKKRIWESEATAGCYIAEKMTAPVTEGYYQLEIIVSVKSEATLLLSELIAVEATPTA
jgi:pimeloyl-ACP methyl ester carboxylesterase